LQWVTTAITASPIDQQWAAWDTFRALLQDRTGRAMACAISTAEPAVAAAMQAEWDQVKRERTHHMVRGNTTLTLDRSPRPNYRVR
jgi:hypothetical protein